MAEHIDLTTSTKLPKSTKYRASIQADSEEYTAGRLNKESGVLDSNTTIYASPATSSVAHLVLKQYNHQYIQVTTYNRAGEVDEVLEKKEVVTLKINSQYSVDLVGEEGYTKSVLKNIDNKKHKIFKNKYIYAKEEAVPKTCTIKIPKTTNQIISFVSTHGVYSSSTTADKTYTVPYDTEYFVEAKSTKPDYIIPGVIKDHDVNKPYTIHSGSPCFDLSTLTLTLTVSPVSQKKVKFYIPSYAHQKVSVTVGANTYTSTNSPVEVPYGSSYTSKLEVDKGYVPGRLRPVLNYNTPQADSTEKLNGIAYGDIQFYASDEVKIDSGILLTDFLDGDKKTERLCDWYTHYHELDETQPQIMIDLVHPHKDEPLYTQLSLTPNAKATNFRHFNLKPEEFEWFFLNHLDEENNTHCVVHIIQSPNQTITVEYKGMKTTKSIVVPKGSKIKATLTLADSDKYIKGALNVPENAEITVDHTITLQATPVKLAKCKVVVPEYPNQKLVVTYNGKKYYTDFIVKNGDTISASVTADTGYTAGNIYFDGDVIDHVDGTYTIKSDCSLYVTDAAPIMRHITIVQQPHETITVVYLGNYYTDSLDVPDGAIVLIPIRADEGYDPGNHHITGLAVHNPGDQPLFSVYSDLTVTAAPATVH